MTKYKKKMVAVINKKLQSSQTQKKDGKIVSSQTLADNC